MPGADRARRGITARLKRLYWPKAAPPKDADGKALPDVGPTPEQAARTGVNPASLPPFHLLVDDLRLGDAWNAAIEATLAELLADGCISEQYRAEWLAATDPLKVQF